MKNAGIAIVGILIIGVAVIAWRWNHREAFAINLERAITKAADRPIVFSQLTDFPWQRVALFGPYTDQSVVRAALGFDWPAYSNHGLDMADSFSLAVFVEDERVTRAVEVARCSPDFDKQLLAKSISRSEALFAVDSRNRCPTLVPPATKTAQGAASMEAHAF